MSLTRRLALAAVAATAALAIAAPSALAGWQIQTAAGTPYTGPLTLTQVAGTNTDWIGISSSTYDKCPNSTWTGTVTNAGPSTPTATISTAYWPSSVPNTVCSVQPGAGPVRWNGEQLPWNVTVQTTAAGAAKFVVQAPRVHRNAFVCLGWFDAKAIDGTLFNPFSGTAQVRFTDAHYPELNNRLNKVTGCGLQANIYALNVTYDARGQNAQGQPIDLKIVSTP